MIVEIAHYNLQDINKANQPFDVIGKIIPEFIDGAWSFSECMYEEPYEKSYEKEGVTSL